MARVKYLSGRPAGGSLGSRRRRGHRHRQQLGPDVLRGGGFADAADARDMRYCDEALGGKARCRATTRSRPTSIAASCGCGAARSTLAIADFDRAIALDPNQPEAYLNKGAALIRLNNPTEALRLFTVALEHNTAAAGDRPFRPGDRQRDARQRPRGL